MLALVVTLGGAGGIAYVEVKNQASALQKELTYHLQLAQADLQVAKDSLKQANTAHDVRLVDKAEVNFIAAKVQFETTRDIAGSSRLLGLVEALPDVGAQATTLHRAVDDIVAMGVAISDAGVVVCGVARELLAPPHEGNAGATLLTVLNDADKALVKVKSYLDRAATAAGAVDSSVVPAGQQATLEKARVSIANGLAAVAQFDQFVPIAREILGADGPRNYLIEQVNPAELRPGGGFIGSYSLIKADQGVLTLLKSGDAYDITNPRPSLGQPGFVPPPGPMLDLVPTTSWSFVDSNFFPDFPTNAITAESFTSSRLGVHLDAVIAIDYYTIAKLLELTGPIHIPGYGITVDSTNLISTVIQGDLTQSSAHKAILAATAGPLMQAVTAMPSSKWTALLTALNDLSSSHHLQVYFNNPSVQQAMDEFAWTDRVNPRDAADFMAENEANLGATKANYFLTRRFRVVLTRQGGLLHHRVILDLTDNMPYSYRPNEFYRAYVRFFMPAAARDATDDLAVLKWPNPEAPRGTRELAGWVQFHGYGHSIERVFDYDTPWPSNSRGIEDVYWQKQPGTADDSFEVDWNNGRGTTYTANGLLHQDLLIKLGPTSLTVMPANPATAHLPSLSLGS